ncbi:hypothetical protein [Natronorarus salvus]|uniref:hypothetical protein n=1 Tax=Natronorarus salvus TaxID=3117733 RepID=UPI002F265B8F
MNPDKPTLASISERLDELTERVGDLETELRGLESESRSESTVETQPTLELRGTTSPDDASLDQIWIAGHPIGLMLTRRRREIERLREEIDERRLDGLETDLPADRLLPIQQVTRTSEVDPSVLSANDRRAAVVWSNLFESCDRTPTKLVLDSSAVKTILQVSEGERPHNETVRRVMERVADLAGDLVSCEIHRTRKALVIDRAELAAFVDDIDERFAIAEQERTR